jgi:hypothetical protein
LLRRGAKFFARLTGLLSNQKEDWDVLHSTKHARTTIAITAKILVESQNLDPKNLTVKEVVKPKKISRISFKA